MASAKSSLIVCAIDFGTTYSGYAYSFKDEFERDPLSVHANVNWKCDSGAFLKTSTVVLLNPDKDFHSLGFKAEEAYASLADDNKHGGWRMFRWFKMLLHEKSPLNRKTILKDDQGRPMEAIKVFSAAIGYLKQHFLDRFFERFPDGTEGDVTWVLTIPAIWTDSAKQFMREAAELAGILPDHLILSLEPEAAALVCRQIPTRSRLISGQKRSTNFPPGSEFMVLDLGGGTADVSVCKVRQDGSLSNLIMPSGGPWGGKTVNEAFVQFIRKIVGDDIYAEFFNENKRECLGFEMYFEMKKRNETLQKADQVRVQLPHILLKIFKKENGIKLAEYLKVSQSHIRMATDKLCVPVEEFKSFYTFSIQNIIKHVRSLFQLESLRHVDTILVVGGFAEACHVKTELKNAFAHKTIIFPDEPALAILKGAVMYGHNPRQIATRILPRTYGISHAVPFDPEVHPQEYKYLDKCEDVFQIFFSAGTTVIPGQTVKEIQFYPPRSQSDGIVEVEIYSTPKKDPSFVREEDCSRVAVLRVHLGDNTTDVRPLVVVRMAFGGTELTVEASQEGSSQIASAKLDFMKYASEEID